jgi:hypothetical protein
MASPIEITLVLCDAAQIDVASGKVHMLGAGWSRTSSPTAPSAVVVMLGIPWDRTNQKIHVILELADADGTPVEVPGPFGGNARVRIEADVEAGRPPGVAEGVTLEANLAPTIPPLPLPPGRYTWNLQVGSDQSAQRSFAVDPPPTSPPTG